MKSQTRIVVALMVIAGVTLLTASLITTAPWHLTRWLSLGGGFLWLVLAIVTWRKNAAS